MNPYQVKLVDGNGHVVSEREIEAASVGTVLKQLSDVGSDAKSIEIFHSDGTKAGATSVSYWRQTLSRR